MIHIKGYINKNHEDEWTGRGPLLSLWTWDPSCTWISFVKRAFSRPARRGKNMTPWVKDCNNPPDGHSGRGAPDSAVCPMSPRGMIYQYHMSPFSLLTTITGFFLHTIYLKTQSSITSYSFTSLWLNSGTILGERFITQQHWGNIDTLWSSLNPQTLHRKNV